MRVVCNAGPLIHLARAAHFDLLRVLFGRVLIPPAVYQEVAVRGKGQDGSREVARAGWIHQRQPRRADLIAALGTFLGRGEAEAIALAAERPNTLLLMDESHGRRVAGNMGITVRGTARRAARRTLGWACGRPARRDCPHARTRHVDRRGACCCGSGGGQGSVAL